MSRLAILSVDERMEKFVEVYQWLRTASQERILSRRNLHLQAVHPFADTLTIVDVSQPDVWRIRLSGTKSCERVGCDKTGSDAMQGFVASERAIRNELAQTLFDWPCGIRSAIRETYENGEFSLLDTVALPLIGPKDERLIVHYAQVTEDIDHDFGARPLAKCSGIESYRFVDLGNGTPDAVGWPVPVAGAGTHRMAI